MSESKVKREHYITIQGFMVTDLKLKGNELIVYAIIYGFSQAERQVFNGCLQYLQDWTNSTKQGVLKSLKSLLDKGYIYKTKLIGGCEYCTIPLNEAVNKVYQRGQQSLPDCGKQSLPNNITNDNIEEKENISIKEKECRNDLTHSLDKERASYNNEDTDNRKPTLNSQKQAITDEQVNKYFQALYERYPRRVGKVQAKTTFEHKVVGFELDEAKGIIFGILDMLEEQKKVWEKENRKTEFIPYFSTWLNDNVEDSKFYKRRRK